eukprot:SAG31_NODE_10288_length_1160_cov_1.448633_1_plen_39_part_10
MDSAVETMKSKRAIPQSYAVTAAPLAQTVLGSSSDSVKE